MNPHPSIVPLDSARKSARTAAFCAFLVSALGLLILLFSFSQEPEDRSEQLAYFADPWLFIDLALQILCGIGLLRYSRTAAVVMFLEYGSGTIDKLLTLHITNPISILPSIVLIILFARGTKGTFDYHRIRKAEDPAYKPGGRWLLWLFGLPVGFVVLLAGTWFLLMEMSLLPSWKILDSNSLGPRHHTTLQTEGILHPDEHVRWFYSNGLFSILEDGNLITDKRLVSYQTEDGELAIQSALFGDIESAEAYDDPEYRFKMIDIHPEEGDVFTLWIPLDDAKTPAFLHDLEQEVSLTFLPD